MKKSDNQHLEAVNNNQYLQVAFGEFEQCMKQYNEWRDRCIHSALKNR